jgi:outer membrane protein OmpA-like peptidoglycan-associated protein
MRGMRGLLQNWLYPVQYRGRRTKLQGVSIVSPPPRTYLPLVTAAILAFAVAAPLSAEVLPERRCGVDQTAATAAPHQGPAVPAYDAACLLTVFFETGSAILAPDARRALDQGAPEIVAHLARGGRLRIDGYAQPSGLDETAELSQRRARVVAAYLEAAWGIPPHQVALRGLGSVLSDGRDPPRTAENRRATLVLDAGLPVVTRLRRSGLPAGPAGHLDLDDFGGAPNPLQGPVIRIWAAPNFRHN